MLVVKWNINVRTLIRSIKEKLKCCICFIIIKNEISEHISMHETIINIIMEFRTISRCANCERVL